MWADLECQKLNADKTRAYLERSKSSPINLQLHEEGDLSPHNPFPQIVSHAAGRLKSLIVNGTPRNLPAIATHLSQPAPLLEFLSIGGNHEFEPQRNPVLATALFNGDLSSLRGLCLQSVRTELPWRNMVNLTSFELGRTKPDHVTIRELLGFFESTPHLSRVKLFYATPTSGAQNGRLVSLAYLKRMSIFGEGPSSLLLDHLIIPVGARLKTEADSDGPLTMNLPKSLDNLRNISSFTKIHLYFDPCYPRIRFSGPNGKVCIFVPPERHPTRLVFEFLARFDTLKTERLEIDHGNSLSSDSPYRALLPMKRLRTLTLSQCRSPDVFIHTLDPNISSSGVVVCPELEELVLELRPDTETLDFKNVADMAAARASRGAKLKSVRIMDPDLEAPFSLPDLVRNPAYVNQGKSMQIDASGIRKHVLHVEYGPWTNAADEDSDSSEEED